MYIHTYIYTHTYLHTHTHIPLIPSLIHEDKLKTYFKERAEPFHAIFAK